MFSGEPEDIGPNIWKGITAHNRVTYLDIARDELKLSTKPLLNVPNLGFMPDILEEIVRVGSSPAGFIGLAPEPFR